MAGMEDDYRDMGAKPRTRARRRPLPSWKTALVARMIDRPPIFRPEEGSSIVSILCPYPAFTEFPVYGSAFAHGWKNSILCGNEDATEDGTWCDICQTIRARLVGVSGDEASALNSLRATKRIVLQVAYSYSRTSPFTWQGPATWTLNDKGPRSLGRRVLAMPYLTSTQPGETFPIEVIRKGTGLQTEYEITGRIDLLEVLNIPPAIWNKVLPFPQLIKKLFKPYTNDAAKGFLQDQLVTIASQVMSEQKKKLDEREKLNTKPLRPLREAADVSNARPSAPENPLLNGRRKIRWDED